MERLADNVRLISGPDVWMEGNATAQLLRIGALPGCRYAVGMPDLHAGPGIPIGAAFAFADGVHPALIGGDCGCGARLVGVPRARTVGDALERRVRELTEGPALPEAEVVPLLSAAWESGPRGLVALSGVPEALADLAAMEPPDGLPPSAPLPPSAAHPIEAWGEALGTIGGGNHFLEVSAVGRVVDRARAADVGVAPMGLAILAHSGSRALGKALADNWAPGPLTGAALALWAGEQAGAIRYARTNRLLLVWRMLQAVGAARAGKVGGSVDVVHNCAVSAADGTWVHRKGCAPAEVGQLTLVLGSRGTPSWLLEGLGAPDALCSVAHGAGRKMGRTEAHDKLKHRYTRASLLRTPLGGRVICDDPALLYEEHPDAYKPVEPVIAALKAAGAARRVAELRPLLTVKR